jgi:hypothetical protein
MALCVRSFHLSSPPFGVWQHRCAFEKRLKNAPFMASFLWPQQTQHFHRSEIPHSFAVAA